MGILTGCAYTGWADDLAPADRLYVSLPSPHHRIRPQVKDTHRIQRRQRYQPLDGPFFLHDHVAVLSVSSIIATLASGILVELGVDVPVRGALGVDRDPCIPPGQR